MKRASTTFSDKPCDYSELHELPKNINTNE